MGAVYRSYACGCDELDEMFCAEAGVWVWRERDAYQFWGVDGIPEEDAKRQAQEAREWLVKHFSEQEKAGAYKDYELPDPDYTEEDELRNFVDFGLYD